MIKAVIFDFDGVLVDSHNIINEIFSKLAKEINLHIKPEEFSFSSGSRFEQRLWYLAREKGLNVKYDDIQKLVEKGRIEYYLNASRKVSLFPGVINLLEKLKKNNYKIGLGTNGSKETVEKLLQELKIKKYFDSIVTYDDVKNGKPHPEMFLKNAKNLKVKPDACVVIEDSEEGIKAAKLAGMKVIAIATTLPITSLKEADLILDSIKKLNLEIIKNV